MTSQMMNHHIVILLYVILYLLSYIRYIVLYSYKSYHNLVIIYDVNFKQLLITLTHWFLFSSIATTVSSSKAALTGSLASVENTGIPKPLIFN